MDGPAVRLGFRQVKGCGRNMRGGSSTSRERRGHFESGQQFHRLDAACRVSSMRGLAEADAFGSLGLSAARRCGSAEAKDEDDPF